MSMLRTRLALSSIVKAVQSAMEATGWTGPEVNYGAEAVQVASERPAPKTTLSANLVVVSFGEPGSRDDAELGTGISSTAYKSTTMPLYLDVYAQSTALALDICDSLLGWFEIHAAYPVLDSSKPGSPVIPGQYAEVHDLSGPGVDQSAEGATDFRKHWRVASGFVTVNYQPLA